MCHKVVIVFMYSFFNFSKAVSIQGRQSRGGSRVPFANIASLYEEHDKGLCQRNNYGISSVDINTATFQVEYCFYVKLYQSGACAELAHPVSSFKIYTVGVQHIYAHSIIIVFKDVIEKNVYNSVSLCASFIDSYKI